MFNSKDEEIINLLKKAPNLSTYQIAKKLKISWSTANLHCYKLKLIGKIDGSPQDSKFGMGEKMIWWTGDGDE